MNASTTANATAKQDTTSKQTAVPAVPVATVAAPEIEKLDNLTLVRHCATVRERMKVYRADRMDVLGYEIEKLDEWLTRERHFAKYKGPGHKTEAEINKEQRKKDALAHELAEVSEEHEYHDTAEIERALKVVQVYQRTLSSLNKRKARLMTGAADDYFIALAVQAEIESVNWSRSLIKNPSPTLQKNLIAAGLYDMIDSHSSNAHNSQDDTITPAQYPLKPFSFYMGGPIGEHTNPGYISFLRGGLIAYLRRVHKNFTADLFA